MRMRQMRASMIAVAGGLLLGGLLGPATATVGAAVINITGDPADAVIRDGSVWHVVRTSQMVAGTSDSGGTLHNYNVVYVFKLPTLSSGAAIQDANLSFYLDANGPGSTPAASLDLYGLGSRSAPDVLDSDWYIGGENDPGATKLQDSIVTDQNDEDTTINTDAAGQASLAAFLQAQYDGGAQGGDYVFLRLNTDGHVENGYYYVDPAGSPTVANRPSLRITTGAVPEPASLALLGLGGLALAGRRRKMA